MSKKLTTEELQKVQALNQKFLQTKVKIADAEINKQKFITELDETQQEFSHLEQELIKVYGQDATIDLRTGEVKQPEKEKDGKDK
tara:strand:+ start:965 stop:1219 length:255 start_codon:yes stop_codon:yes gene_type:complete